MFQVAYKTDIGLKREINEDSVLVCEDLGLFIVADGMGGHNAGEVASSLAVSIIEDYIRSHIEIESKQELIQNAFLKANRDIYLKSLNDPECRGMGTTCSLVLSEEADVYIGHVGDSRIYYVANESIKQITEDHTLVEKLIKNGEITREAAKIHPKRNVITRALGTDSELKVDYLSQRVENGSKILICSDGLTGKINDDEILKMISTNTIECAVESLVKLANDRGGLDNITIILISF